MAQKPALGKGLASLFPGMASITAAPVGSPEAAPAADFQGTGATAAGAQIPAPPRPGATPTLDAGNRDRHMGISLAAIDDIQVNQYQPRRDFDETTLLELSLSIQANGIIQPLVVRKSTAPGGGYQLIAGERRLRAAKLAGLKQVPIVIRRSTDREALELALVENIQRQDLNCVDESLAYQQLHEEFKLTQEEIATRVGKERATVANYLRLLRLPQAILDDLKRQILSFGHGKALLGLEDNDQRLLARAEIIKKKLSVRDTEALVETLKKGASMSSAGNKPAEAPTAMQSRLQTAAVDLTRRLSARVELRGSERRGKIQIHYGSRQDLDRILEALQTI